NRYINEAIDYYNRLQKRKILEQKIQNESLLVRNNSMSVLKEFERIEHESSGLRVHIAKGIANMRENSDIIIDQLRSIDNKRFLKKIGKLPQDLAEKVKKNIMIVLDI
ncbi:MAG: type II toxin-antitoxin system PemK/MazF family toxin, partial [Thermodesulfobacteriota bacterium]|nr:type II toxin-antitoxin system PemK/MazF family toxin [Thermodesulfobacteriota bacterium]